MHLCPVLSPVSDIRNVLKPARWRGEVGGLAAHLHVFLPQPVLPMSSSAVTRRASPSSLCATGTTTAGTAATNGNAPLWPATPTSSSATTACASPSCGCATTSRTATISRTNPWRSAATMPRPSTPARLTSSSVATANASTSTGSAMGTRTARTSPTSRIAVSVRRGSGPCWGGEGSQKAPRAGVWGKALMWAVWAATVCLTKERLCPKWHGWVPISAGSGILHTLFCFFFFSCREEVEGAVEWFFASEKICFTRKEGNGKWEKISKPPDSTMGSQPGGQKP